MAKEGVVVAGGVLAMMTVIAGVTGAVFMALHRAEVYTLPAHGNYCQYETSPAMPLGVMATVLSLTTQVLASTAIGCCRPWRNVPGQSRRDVLLFFGTWAWTWYQTIQSVLLFMVGAVLGFDGSLYWNGSCTAPCVTTFLEGTFVFLLVVNLDFNLYTNAKKDSAKAARLQMPPSGMATRTSGAAKW